MRRLLTIVGGRPRKDEAREKGVSDGFAELLDQLAADPALAESLAADPQGTLDSLGLALTPTELAMLQAMPASTLAWTAIRQGSESPESMDELDRDEDSQAEWEDYQRRQAQVELVTAVFGPQPVYFDDMTRGIRPADAGPPPGMVVEALLGSSAAFREAFLANPEAAILAWPALPLDADERRHVLAPPLLERLKRAARDG
jgi:hypothetical protein